MGLPARPLRRDAGPAGLIGLLGGPRGSGLVVLGTLCTTGPNLGILLLLLHGGPGHARALCRGPKPIQHKDMNK